MKIYAAEVVRSARLHDIDKAIAEAKPIGETEDIGKGIPFGSVISYKGRLYSIVSGEEIGEDNGRSGWKWIAVEPVAHIASDPEEIEENEYDASGSEHIICPICGYEERDSFEVQEDDDAWECPRCGSILAVSVDYSVTYSTTVKSPCKVYKVKK